MFTEEDTTKDEVLIVVQWKKEEALGSSGSLGSWCDNTGCQRKGLGQAEEVKHQQEDKGHQRNVLPIPQLNQQEF